MRIRPAITLLCACLLLAAPAFAGLRSAVAQGNPNLPGSAGKIDPALLPALARGEMVSAIVTFRQQTDLAAIPGRGQGAGQQGLIHALQATSQASQQATAALLGVWQTQGQVTRATYFWIFNGLSLTATPAVLQALAARDDVARITPDAIHIVPEALQTGVEPNLVLAGAPALWDLGWRGQGVVVASMDSGVDVNHPDLVGRWRGGSNSWYDPSGQHPDIPTDLSGHGTWTMGVMVGGAAGGTAIGMAPDATWIAVKIFDDAGTSSATTIHLGYQWLLDPDGNPATPDAPDIVNNSWSFGTWGCNLEFELDLEALQAAGIVPVFAAGNYGPNAPSDVSPGNNPAAFAVGAVDNNQQIYAYSSRGPSACDGTIYPEVTAPGVVIRTSEVNGVYTSATGTSLAAPHVAGALALLRSAFPQADADLLQASLTGAAVDLGAIGADDTFGYGRLDSVAAYNWIATGNRAPTATPGPAPQATPTTTPTPQASTVHIGDLDGAAVMARNKKSWTATVTILAHSAGHSPLDSATVTGSWSSGVSGTATCVTNTSGSCQISVSLATKTTPSVTFTVNAVSSAGAVYAPADNHDPDGETNGTTLAVTRP